MRKRARNQLSNAAKRARQRKRTKVYYCMNFVLLLLLCYGVYSIGLWLHKSSTFKLKYFHVNVDGNYVPAQVFQQRIKNKVNGGFFSFDAGMLKQTLLQDPWVKSVYIRRVFPNALDVSIKERQPFAYWNADGIVTRQGKMFYPKEIPQLDCPRFFASDEDRFKLINMYNSFMQLAAPLKITIKSMSLAKNDDLSLVLSNGVAINLGKLERQRRFQQFIAASSQLHNGKLHVKSVDLRYPSGFAVQWTL